MADTVATHIADLDHWALLMDVCPLFECTLNWRPLDDDTLAMESIAESAALFKASIKEIPVHVPTDYQLDERSRSDVLREMDLLLSSLEALVNNEALRNHDSICSGPNLHPDLARICPKLTALAKLIEGDIEAPPIGYYGKLLHLAQNPPKFKAIRYVIERFNSAMARILIDPAPIPALGQSRVPEGLISKRIASSRTFALWSEHLFHSLVKHLQRCNDMHPRHPEHCAMLQVPQLPALDEDQGGPPAMYMLLASCPDQRQWQQIRFVKSLESDNTEDTANPLVKSICKRAQKAHKMERIFTAELRGSSLREITSTVFGQELLHPNAPPTVSLADLLKRGILRDRYRFPPSDKRRLLCTLSQALLCFHGGPWLQTLWTSDNIFFAHDPAVGRIYNVHHPYISCRLSEKPPPITTLDPRHPYPLILSFAMLLVEIQTGKEVDALQENGTPDLLLSMIHISKSWRSQQLDMSYADVLDACVMFPKYLREEQDRNTDANVVDVILERIVHPLQMGLGMSREDEFGVQHIDLRTGMLTRDGRPVPTLPVAFLGASASAPSIESSVVSTRREEASSAGSPRLSASARARDKTRDSMPAAAWGMPRRSRGVESRRHPVEHARRAIVRDEVEVAIICSLPLEANAVLALFDDHWDEGPPGLTDAYSYSFGTLGGHHVVLAHPSGIGKAKAANAAATCASSFRNIRLALVVGICGGAPAAENKEEILLGDVVISSGIIQYDFGRQFPDHFRPKNTLKEPNARVGSLLAKLKTDFHRKALQGKVSEALAQSGASYPGNGDVLFQSSYRHRHQAPLRCAVCLHCDSETQPTCEAAMVSGCHETGCDNAHQVARRRGNVKHEPAVHVGIVASGDSVIKSGKHRDNIIHETQAIAFEMEGAGVWDNFDCVIVVKGVCDYADSHKNKLWQGYAADTAAACTRALLQFWRGRPVR